MARTRKALPQKVDVAHLISTGVLASVCPRPLIDEVLEETGRGSQRNRLLPAPAVVYYVMALALWREAPLEEVLRVVCEGLQWLSGGQAGAMQASKSGISQARSRLGSQKRRWRLPGKRMSSRAATCTTWCRCIPGVGFRSSRRQLTSPYRLSSEVRQYRSQAVALSAPRCRGGTGRRTRRQSCGSPPDANAASARFK